MANEEKKVEEVEAKEPAPDDIANKPAPDAPNDDREQAHPLSSEVHPTLQVERKAGGIATIFRSAMQCRP